MSGPKEGRAGELCDPRGLRGGWGLVTRNFCEACSEVGSLWTFCLESHFRQSSLRLPGCAEAAFQSFLQVWGGGEGRTQAWCGLWNGQTWMFNTVFYKMCSCTSYLTGLYFFTCKMGMTTSTLQCCPNNVMYVKCEALWLTQSRHSQMVTTEPSEMGSHAHLSFLKVKCSHSVVSSLVMAQSHGCQFLLKAMCFTQK